ncbi:MAG: hypothetical protein ONB44_22775 [candidate division KSB1 bacterium]|nr:hypothetical protein [candidate division KSB1 bacterium]MDZ7304963.1 hypothetical protein [candidate division KSB1 bacterium]MDZ7314004.1 hypothetical protein [candidate division KSB1 bacterium]
MLNKKEIPVLVAEINDELAKLEKLAQRLATQQGRVDDEEISESAALRLHNFYTGCERIFKLIAVEVNGALSQSLDWYKRLLNQAALEVTGIRPAVISAETRKDLEELLNFRHIVRNIYAFELKSERIEELIELTTVLFPRFAREIAAFTGFLMKVYQQT